MSKEVVLRCYDISRGLASSVGSRLLGYPMEAVWHSGVVVFGREFFYGGGIQEMTPLDFESAYGIQPLKLLTLGTTNKSIDEFREFLDSNFYRFTEETYNLLHWNCNHFSNECVKFLLDGKEAPREIVHQHELIQQSPLGATVINMIQNMSVANPIGDRNDFRYVPSTSSVATPTANQTTSSDAEQKELSETEFGQTIQKMLNATTKEVAMTAFETLEKLAANILNNSTVSKYRIIKKSNANLQASLLAVPHGIDCLKALGFEEKDKVEGEGASEPGFEFSTVSAQKLRDLFQCRRLLQSVLQSKFNIQPPRPTAASPEVEAPSAHKYKYQIEQLAAMGFVDQEKTVAALEASRGNINQALDKLMGL